MAVQWFHLIANDADGRESQRAWNRQLGIGGFDVGQLGPSQTAAEGDALAGCGLGFSASCDPAIAVLIATAASINIMLPSYVRR
jgi:hypothetical protein